MTALVVVLIIAVKLALVARAGRGDGAATLFWPSRSFPGWVLGLSSFATSASAFMCIGYIGLVAGAGLSGVALVLGWALGEYLGWRIGWPGRVRIATGGDSRMSLLGLIAGKVPGSLVARGILLIPVVFFLTLYFSAQVIAAGKGLAKPLGMNSDAALVTVAALVTAYVLLGGRRGDIQTDVVQGILVILLMGVLAVRVVLTHGNAIIESALSSWETVGFWTLLGVTLAWIPAGLGVLGQAHIIPRWMLLASAKDETIARRVNVCAFFCLFVPASIVGLGAYSTLDLANIEDTDLIAEAIVFSSGGEFLAQLFAVLVLLCAMSTADALLISAAQGVREVFPYSEGTRGDRAAILVMALFGSLLALTGGNVFGVVVAAWSWSASWLCPPILLHIYRGRQHLVTTMVSSVSSVAVFAATTAYGSWDEGPRVGLSILAGFLSGIATNVLQQPRSKRMQSQ